MTSRSRAQYVDPDEHDNQNRGDSNLDQDHLKPARACQSCRISKVRCIQPDDSRPCVRCQKVGRQCLPTQNSNKRQKRHDDRSINELEVTLAALTSTLHRQRRDAYGCPRDSTTGKMATTASHSATAAISGTGSSPEGPSNTFSSLQDPSQRDVAPSAPVHTITVSASSEHSAPQLEAKIGEIIDEDIATAVYEEYTTKMLPEFPFVAISPNTSARDVWRNTPITFLSILDVAADGFCDLEVSRKLRKLLVQTYATFLLGANTLSLPLLQALIISAVWHRAIEPAQPGEQMDVYQISHAAANMAILMGLGRSLKAQTWSGPMPTQARRLREPASEYQASSLDARRIWLGCHYICSNTSMALQTPNIMRWTRCMDECLEVLDTSPYSLPSDKILCLHVRLQHIIEDFELQFSSSDTGPTAAEVTHRAFKRQLASWASAPPAWTDPLRFSQQFVALYMHEVAMYSNSTADHPLGSGSSNIAKIDPAEFTNCLAAAHGLLDVFLTLNMSLIRALPTLYFVRLTYAALVLVKLHSAAIRLPNHDDSAQKTLSLKTDDYLSRMLQKLSGWGTLWPAWRLTKCLRRVRELFRQSSNKEVIGSELACLSLWTFKEPSVIENIGEATANGCQAIAEGSARGAQGTDNSRQEALEAQSLKVAQIPPPAPQMLPIPGGSDPAWDLPKIDASDPMLFAMHNTLPSMNLGDPSPWDSTQLDMWLDTNMNTSTFDFDGDLQSTIQYLG